MHTATKCEEHGQPTHAKVQTWLVESTEECRSWCVVPDAAFSSPAHATKETKPSAKKSWPPIGNGFLILEKFDGEKFDGSLLRG